MNARATARTHCDFTEIVTVDDLTYEVSVTFQPAFRDAYGFTPSETEITGVTLDGKDATPEQRDEVLRAMSGSR